MRRQPLLAVLEALYTTLLSHYRTKLSHYALLFMLALPGFLLKCGPLVLCVLFVTTVVGSIRGAGLCSRAFLWWSPCSGSIFLSGFLNSFEDVIWRYFLLHSAFLVVGPVMNCQLHIFRAIFCSI